MSVTLLSLFTKLEGINNFLDIVGLGSASIHLLSALSLGDMHDFQNGTWKLAWC